MKTTTRLTAALLLLAALNACSLAQSMTKGTDDLRLVARDMTAALTSGPRDALAPDATVITTTFVNVDDLKKSSTLGRAMSGHVTTALNDLGYRVVALNLTQTLQIREEAGELALSRNVKELLATGVTPDALVTGTYYKTYSHVYLTGRLVDPASGEILASHEVRLPLTDDLARITASGGNPGALFPRR